MLNTLESNRSPLEKPFRVLTVAASISALVLLSVQPKLSTAAVQGPAPNKIVLESVPHVVKLPDFGGEACLEMCLRSQGHAITQKDIFNFSGIDPILARGCGTNELYSLAKGIGLDPGTSWFNDNGPKSIREKAVNRAVRVAISELSAERPTVFLTRQSSDNRIIEQFVLLVGHDSEQNVVWIHDPKNRNGRFRKISIDQFRRSILLKDTQNREYVFCMTTRPVEVKIKSKTDKGFSNADYAQHIMQLKKQLPSDAFKIVIQKPFVVVGDESEIRVKQRALNTVKWAVDRLKKQYFAKDPKFILNVWLFKDEKSYYKNATDLWGTRPTTRFGYYSSYNKALVMNINTGGGTLVHEIVHPFIESNFEKCPSWFNEGLASLYEQSQSEGDKIVGSTNWRLRRLQITIDSGRLQSFEDLMSTTRREFYDDDRGNNYAQARYLCYYLQQKGLLNQYYHSFVKNVDKDPTGIKTLKSVLKTDDLVAFQAEWEKFVMKLVF